MHSLDRNRTLWELTLYSSLIIPWDNKSFHTWSCEPQKDNKIIIYTIDISSFLINSIKYNFSLKISIELIESFILILDTPENFNISLIIYMIKWVCL